MFRLTSNCYLFFDYNNILQQLFEINNGFVFNSKAFKKLINHQLFLYYSIAIINHIIFFKYWLIF